MGSLRMHWVENSQSRFSCKYCVKIPDTFLEKMKQIISSKNSSKDSSTKASIDKLSQLETQIETLDDKKTVLVLQNTLAQKERKKEEHIEILQDRITELQWKKVYISANKTVKMREIKKEARGEHIKTINHR